MQKSQSNSSVRLPVMPTSGAAPLWLLRLYTLQRYSSIVSFLLVAATLVVYGLTVYSQELWSQEYRKWKNLERNERQLTITNPTLVNKMAEDAEQPTTGLISPNPARTIFLSPVSPSPIAIPADKIPSGIQQQTPSPLGY